MNRKELTVTYLESAEKRILKAISFGSSSDASQIDKYFADNAFIFRQSIALLQKEKRFLNSIEKERGNNLVFLTLWKNLKTNSFNVCEVELIKSLSPLNLSVKETDMLKSLVIVCCIIEAGLVCKFKPHNSDGFTRLNAVVSALKVLDELDFEALYPKVSTAVSVIEKNEPLFSGMTKETKSQYRKALQDYAKKKKISELDAALLVAETAERQGTLMGEVLEIDKPKKSAIYCLLTAFFFFLFCGLAFWLCDRSLLIVLLAVPLGFLAFSASDFLFSVFGGVTNCPALKLDSVPENGRTLTVITTLLTGKQNDQRLFENIERFCILNDKKGLHFGLLCDLPDSDKRYKSSDKETIAFAVEKTRELNEKTGGRFTLFLRKRDKKLEGGYGGKERKRGAVESLIKLIYRKENKFSLIEGEIPKNISFLLTLDSDTSLTMDSVSELVGAMLHPLNRPKIKDGKVVKGYGILQPAVKTSLESSAHSRFSAMISAVGGIDIYESAGFERHQQIFGEGIFCGKGIIDVKLYGELLCDRLPENKVLSHDMPEGNVLRTRYVGDVSFTDSTPKNLIAYYDRLHRWIRGDVQNLALLKGYGQGLRGAWRILANVLRHLAPVLSLVTFILSAFFVKGNKGIAICLFALLPSLSPIVFTFFSRPLGLRFRIRRFFSAVTNGLMQSFKSSAHEVLTLVYKSHITVDAFLRSLYRMAVGKKLLVWQTAAEVDRATKEKTVYFIYRCLLSSMIGAVLFFFSNLWISRLLGMVWFLFPLYAKFVSLPLPAVKGFSDKQKKKLCGYSEAMWRFFKDNTNEKTAHLPPDNVQFSPVEVTAMRTSPTNVGLYLTSCLAARDFGFISTSELKKRVSCCLDTVKKLKKWNGHLYNWYSLPDLELLGGGYVSTVDSGNFCVCLIALAEGLEEYGLYELADEARSISLSADFTCLYNAKRDLFSLGFDTQTNTLSSICYDLYMSEARSGSYFALAFGQAPKEHIKKLRRPIFSCNGYIGMASWSGTAFEYFMPQLFLPLYKNSFVDESLRFAYSQQKRFSSDGLFGTSESGYYRFDSEMNYQYKAHGVSSLSIMRHDENEMVLSPYSLFLFLCVAKNGPLRALEAFENKGAYGEYGFYEAVDLSPSRSNGAAVIQSYMAHHVGMSILACANAVFDNAFIKRFMRHPKTGALYELFQEQIPINATIYSPPENLSNLDKKRTPFVERLTSVTPLSPVTAMLGRGKSSIAAGSGGHVAFKYNGVNVNEAIFDRFDVSKTFGLCFYDGNGLYSAAYYDGGEGCFSFESSESYVSHICSSDKFSGRVKYGVSDNGSFVIESKAESKKSFSLFYSFDVQLAEDKEFYAHSSFSRLFITSSFSEEEKALIYRKGSRDGKSALYLAVGFSDKRIDFEFETSNDYFNAFSVSKPADRFAEIYRNKTGVCVNPCCVIKTVPLAGGESKLILSCGKSESEALEALNRTRLNSKFSRGISLISEGESKLLTALLYGNYKGASFDNVSVRDLWRFGISGDVPLITVAVREFNAEDITFYVKTFKRLRNLGLKTEFCFLVSEKEKYSRPLESSVRTVISRLEADDFIGKKNGLFFVESNEENDKFFKTLSDYFTESFDSPFDYNVEEINENCPPCVESNPQPYSLTVESGFNNSVFTVDKTEKLKAPFSYVLAGRRFGSVVTHGNLGYTFFRNASTSKICAFFGDPYKSGNEGERLIFFGEKKIYDLVPCSAYVSFGDGLAVYRGQIEGRFYTLTVYVCEKLPVKIFEVNFDDGRESKVSLEVIPSMGNGLPARKGVIKEKRICGNNTAVFFKNLGSLTVQNVCAFAGRLKHAETCFSRTEQYGIGKQGFSDIVSVWAVDSSHLFFLGAAPTSDACEKIVQSLNPQVLKREKEVSLRFARTLLSPIQIKSKDNATALYFNGFSLYQVGACRFYARGSFYQSGGAYGFRDQLQDCLALIYTSPKEVRTHLIRAAARQYEEGDVQHWWHAFEGDGGFRGLRTKCSDDLLWLPYCVADYVEKTDDVSVLNTEVYYLHSETLHNEDERYENAERSNVKEKLYLHCVKAFDCAFKLGAHGLPLMGSCDWNDAFSAMGEGSESVFVAWLYVLAAEKFIPISRLFGDEETVSKLKKRISILKTNAENTFTNDRYARAYFGNGSALGIESSDACKIDLLSQAFSVFANADKVKAKTGVSTAYNKLFCNDTKIMRLFDPPFSDTTVNAGYINGYATGIRENGGQYTHGALWFADACLKLGMLKEGFSILNGSNPVWRSNNINLSSSYKTEPYAICADIYDGVGQRGRGGWSWYTGAAAWYYKIVTETVLGIKLSNGFKLIEVKPLIEYESVFEQKDFRLKIIASKEFNVAKLDGVEVTLPFVVPEGEHNLEVPLE